MRDEGMKDESIESAHTPFPKKKNSPNRMILRLYSYLCQIQIVFDTISVIFRYE